MKGNKNNIILIGMPGVGKSTIGVVLAKILGYKFVDSDLVIQEKTGRLLKDIIAQDGIDEFVKIENEINAGLDVEKSIIATGGSVVYGEEAMEHLREIGTVVYLKLDLYSLSRRLGSLEKRGVVLKKNQTLKDLFYERTQLYKKYAYIIVNEHGCSITDTVNKIVKKLEE